MNAYQSLSRKAVGIAFMLGPLLFLVGSLYTTAIVLSLGEGLEAQGKLYLEGVLMSYAVILFIPVYLELARIMGAHLPRYGIICAGLGLFGMAAAVLAATARIWQLTFIRAGVLESVWDLLETTPEILPVALLAPFGPLASLLLGVGLLRVPSFSLWRAALLILAGFSFVMAQAVGIGFVIFYPIATIAWTIALVPLGWRYLSGEMAGQAGSAHAAAS
jgi:hypothetical protein